VLQLRREGVQLTEAGSVLKESRAMLSRIDHGISRPARRRAWGGRIVIDGPRIQIFRSTQKAEVKKP